MTTTALHSKTGPTIAVVGCGAITESFYLPALKVSPVLDKLILVDANLERARNAAAQFGAKRTVTNYRDIISEVDGVIVAVPHHLHYPIAKDFLAKGVHVLCEKPMAETCEEALEMVRLAESHNTTITVNHTRRFLPSAMKVKELLAAGTIGKVKSLVYLDGGEFSWPTASGFYFDSSISKKGVLLDIGTHVLDLICWWLEGKPRLISSFNDSFGGIEGVASVELEYQGCKCDVRLSRLSKLPNYYRIEGEKGIIEGGVYDARNVTLILSNGVSKVLTSPTREDGFSGIARRLVNNFLDVMKRDASPLVSGRDVLPTAELIDEAYAKARRFPMAWYEPQEVQYVS